MISSKDPDLFAAWQDACRERDAAITREQETRAQLVEIQRRYAAAVRHPSGRESGQ